MPGRASAFAAWLDDFFAAYYRHRPVNATFIGVHRHDDRLPDYSERGTGDVLAEMDTLSQRLRTLPSESLCRAEALDRKLAKGFLEIQQWEYSSHHYHRRNPSIYTGEAIFGVMSLFLRTAEPLSLRVQAAIARLEQIPALLAQGKVNVRQSPPAWTERARRECTGALAFLGEGIDRLMQQQCIGQSRLRTAADKAMVAFAYFQRYLERELRQHPVDAYACGAEAFDFLLRRGHFLQAGADTVEAYAREVLAKSRASLEKQATCFGAQTWREALAQLSDHHPTVEGYYSGYTDVWQACRTAVEAHNLVAWINSPIRYIPQPDWARQAAPYLYFLFYRSPAPYDQVPVVDHMVTPIEPDMLPEDQERLLRSTNHSVIKLNHVIHHGSIGHHLQNTYAVRAQSRIGQVAAVDCAYRIAMFCGGTMAEGWACYATDLMDEIGFLTPLEHYAHIHARLRMAARAIVDINLHHEIFSAQEAIDFYCQQTGMTPEAASAEVVRNSMFPGSAMMYLTGTSLIHQLRHTLALQQGTAFDLRRFHDQFLSYGSVPVSLICTAMQENEEETETAKPKKIDD